MRLFRPGILINLYHVHIWLYEIIIIKKREVGNFLVCPLMLKGFLGDFPCFSKQEPTNEAAVFVRSEIDDAVNIPIAKKIKIEEIVQEGDKENTDRHVKFSGAPPVQYFTFPDSEYDRSPLNQPICKWKRRF